MHSILKILAHNVRKQRLARGMALEELSAKARVSLHVLARIEAAQSNPVIDTVFRIARALGVPAPRLFEEPRSSVKAKQQRRRTH
jgi:transcriptional regulator with XRE-family HTH domain